MNTMMNLKAKSLVPTVASDLRTGDICAGSGFVVTHGAWRGVHTPKGKVSVEGYYPSNGKPGMNTWNARTRVSVYREV